MHQAHAPPRPGALCRLGGAAAALLLAHSARGQDALLNALTIDRAITPPTNDIANLSPEGPHLGPVQLSYGVYSGLQFNDNINGSQSNPQADTLLRGGLNFDLFWPATDNSTLHLGGAIGYVRYIDTPENSGLEISPDSALTWQIQLNDATLTLYDQASYLQQGTQVPALANVTTLPRLDNTVGARVSWEPAQWRLEAGYSHDNYLSTASAYQYLNRSSEYFFTRDGWRLAENSDLGLEASAGLTDYEEAAEGKNQSFSAGAYANWQVTPSLLATIRGGPSFYFFDSAPGGPSSSSLNSSYFGLDITDQLTDFCSQKLDIERDVSLGINQGSGYVKQLTTSYSVSLALTRWMSLDGSLSYDQGNQPLQEIFAFTQENFDFYGTGATLQFRLQDKLSAGLGYSWWRRTSNLSGRGYTQNVATLNIRYEFW
jgi:hypothetical protein